MTTTKTFVIVLAFASIAFVYGEDDWIIASPERRYGGNVGLVPFPRIGRSAPEEAPLAEEAAEESEVAEESDEKVKRAQVAFPAIRFGKRSSMTAFPAIRFGKRAANDKMSMKEYSKFLNRLRAQKRSVFARVG
jgi:hypothetical protein